MSTKLYSLINRFLHYDGVLQDSFHLYDDLGADSLTMMEIVGAIEAEYEIEDIPDDELAEVKTVGDIKKLMCKYTLSI